MIIMKVFTTHLKSEFDDKDDKYQKTQQNNNIDTKLPNVFNYLKNLRQRQKI